jgi:hypothetical protein
MRGDAGGVLQRCDERAWAEREPRRGLEKARCVRGDEDGRLWGGGGVLACEDAEGGVEVRVVESGRTQPDDDRVERGVLVVFMLRLKKEVLARRIGEE